MNTDLKINANFFIQTRDNKGAELTWVELDRNLKILAIQTKLYDSLEDSNNVSKILVDMDTPNFGNFSNDTDNLQNFIDSARQMMIDELNNRDNGINSSSFEVIPFRWYDTGEGLSGQSLDLITYDGNNGVGFSYSFISRNYLNDLGYFSSTNDTLGEGISGRTFNGIDYDENEPEPASNGYHDGYIVLEAYYD